MFKWIAFKNTTCVLVPYYADDIINETDIFYKKAIEDCTRMKIKKIG